MTGSAYPGVLDLTAGAVLACAVVALWRRDLNAIVSALAVQGAALGLTAGCSPRTPATPASRSPP